MKAFGLDWTTATIYDIEGIDINARLEDERTPLHLAAAYSSDPEIIGALEGICIGTNMQGKISKELLNKGRECLLTYMRNNITPPKDLVALVQQTEDEHLSEVIDALIKYFPKMNAPDKSGKTPLHYAAWYNNNPKIISALMDDCPFTEIDKQDEDGKTALHYAVRHNANHKITLALVENKPPPHLSANLDIRDKDRWTPLHYAALHNSNSEIISILLKADVDATVENKDGETAYDLIQKNPALKGDPICEELRKKCSK